jgi:hypothetical protein
VPNFRFPGEGLKGARVELVGQTRPDALFLTLGAQLNNPQLAVVHGWFHDNLWLRALGDPSSSAEFEALRLRSLVGDRAFRRSVEDLLRIADVGVVGLEPVEQDISPSNNP